MKEIKLGELTVVSYEWIDKETLLMKTKSETDKDGDSFHIEIENDHGNISYSKCYEHEVLPYDPPKTTKEAIYVFLVVRLSTEAFKYKANRLELISHIMKAFGDKLEISDGEIERIVKETVDET